MACCSTKNSGKNYLKESPLSKTIFDEIKFTVKNSQLSFDALEGVFKQISNNDPTYRRSAYENEKLIEQETLKKEIDIKQQKIKYLKEKMLEVDQKIEKMNKILNVDINERDYVNEMKQKYLGLEEKQK